LNDVSMMAPSVAGSWLFMGSTSGNCKGYQNFTPKGKICKSRHVSARLVFRLVIFVLICLQSS
jgi:hypothetical protein